MNSYPMSYYGDKIPEGAEDKMIEAEQRALAKECGPDVSSWFLPRTWPKCACGFDPKDNEVLRQHWADAGFEVYEDQYTLRTRPIEEPEGMEPPC